MAHVQTQVNVGDKIIYVREYGHEPLTATVIKVTPSGQLAVDVLPDARFKRTYRQDEYKSVGGSGREKKTVYLYSDIKLAELTDRHQKYLTHQQEKKDAEQQRRNDRDARIATELADLKAACGGDVNNIVRHREIMLDGSRIVWLNIPVLPDSRNPFCVGIVRLSDETNLWGEEGKPIECKLTTFPSGASYSSFRAATDEDALWEAARNARCF